MSEYTVELDGQDQDMIIEAKQMHYINLNKWIADYQN